MLSGIIKRLLGRPSVPGLGDWRLQYEAMFDNMPVGVSFLTSDMRYIRINPYLEKKLGISSAEIAGKYCYDVVGMYKDDPARSGVERICDVCGVKTALETGMPYKFTRKVNDGFIVDNMGVPVKSAGGEVLGAAEIIMDVTERVGLEERLQEYASDLENAVREKTRELRNSRSFLDNIIQSTGDAIFTLDGHAGIKFLNIAAEKLLGRPAGSLIDRSLVELADEEGGARILSSLGEAGQRGGTVYNVRVVLDGGETGQRVMLMSFAPLTRRDGSSLFVCVSKDVTREDRLDREHKEFLAMLTHDLKTPIASVLGYSSLVLGGTHGKVGGELELSVKGIRASASKMLGLVNNFLTAGKLEEKDVPQNRAGVNLGDKLADCISSMRPLIDDKDLSVSCDIETGLPSIMADSEQMERLVYNLMSNAVKFSPRGGNVRARAYRADGGLVALEVTDSGPGVPEEDVQHVFNKYFRGSRGNGSGGTGLGLYISKKIVDSHKGSIELAGGGTGAAGSTFTVRLPAVS